MPDTVASPDAPAAPERKHDPARARQDILDVATEEFARNGLTGARVDAIAARTRTTKRMIYYYFGSKEGLFVAVLERAYAGIRLTEQHLALDRMAPAAALADLVGITFDYHDRHPNFVRLISIENVHFGAHARDSASVRAVNRPAIETLGAVLRRGQDAGVFRRDVDAVDLHLMISSLCFHRVSNQYTFGVIFDLDLTAPDTARRHRRMVIDMIARFVAVPHAA